MKKLVSMALALVMLCGLLCVPASAAAVPSMTPTYVYLTLEDVELSAAPIGFVAIYGLSEVVWHAYMFDQAVSVRMKDGRTFMEYDCNFGDGGYADYIQVDEGQFAGIDSDSSGIWYFALNDEGTIYCSPYMVSKSHIDSLIAEGFQVDIQSLSSETETPSTPAEPAEPVQPIEPAQPEQPTEPAKPETPVVPDEPGSYTVKKGDTWSSICINFYGDNAQRYALQKANSFAALKEGTVITLPETLGKSVLIAAPELAEGEVLYTVKAGDTLGKIAAAQYGKVGEYKAIFERNADRLKNANTIYEGQVIVLPAK